MEKHMEDRRVFARIRVKIPLKFSSPSIGVEGEAETMDISANGVGFLTKTDIPMHAPIEMWLQIPDHQEPVHIIGHVVWSCSTPDKEKKRIGVELEEERLITLARALLFEQKDTETD